MFPPVLATITWPCVKLPLTFPLPLPPVNELNTWSTYHLLATSKLTLGAVTFEMICELALIPAPTYNVLEILAPPATFNAPPEFNPVAFTVELIENK